MTTFRAAHGKPSQLCLDGTDDPGAAAFEETPRGALVALLDAVPELVEYRVLAEPCAGAGAIPRHMAALAKRRGLEPWMWSALIELRDERTRLDGLGAHVLSPQDVTALACEGVPQSEAVVTNLPWYRGVIPVCEAVWALWPNAPLFGLCCERFAMDGKRADWFVEHLPARTIRLRGRQRFTKHKGTYAHPVAWYCWLPGGKAAERCDFTIASTTEAL